MVYEDSHCLPLVSSLIVRALALLRWIEPIQLCEEMEHWAVSVAARWEADLRTTSSDFSSELFSVASVCNEAVPTHLSRNSYFFNSFPPVRVSEEHMCLWRGHTHIYMLFVMGEDEAGLQRGTLGGVLFLITISVHRLEETTFTCVCSRFDC